jgi:putative transposase
VERSSYRYEPRPDRNIALREELVKLARQKPRYGYRRLHALLQRRGHEVNVKRVYRLYAEEGLAVRRRKRKRLVRDRALEPRLIRPNQEWAMDFIIDGLATGRMVRILSVVDAYTRECLALEADTSLGSGRVTRVLERLIGERGRPENLRTDNGPEFTSRRLLGWAEDWKVGMVHIQPGRPMQNGHVESFHGRLRDECLNASWFPYTERRKKHPGKLAAGVQLRASAQLARLQDAGGVPAESRLSRCGKQTTLPTSAQPRLRRLRDNLKAKPKRGNSSHHWVRNRGQVTGSEGSPASCLTKDHWERLCCKACKVPFQRLSHCCKWNTDPWSLEYSGDMAFG